MAGTKTTTRDQILDATERIMARYGFRKMTMEDIAREARVGRRTIYLYFKNKEDVALSSIGRVVELAETRMREIIDEPADCVEKLRRMLRERVVRRVMAVAEYHESLDEVFEIVRPAYIERRNHYFRIERDLIVQVIKDGIGERRFFVENAEETAAILLSATNAYLPYSLSVRELGQPEEIQRQLELMIQLLLRGLTHPA